MRIGIVRTVLVVVASLIAYITFKLGLNETAGHTDFDLIANAGLKAAAMFMLIGMIACMLFFMDCVYKVFRKNHNLHLSVIMYLILSIIVVVTVGVIYGTPLHTKLLLLSMLGMGVSMGFIGLAIDYK